MSIITNNLFIIIVRTFKTECYFKIYRLTRESHQSGKMNVITHNDEITLVLSGKMNVITHNDEITLVLECQEMETILFSLKQYTKCALIASCFNFWDDPKSSNCCKCDGKHTIVSGALLLLRMTNLHSDLFFAMLKQI